MKTRVVNRRRDRPMRRTEELVLAAEMQGAHMELSEELGGWLAFVLKPWIQSVEREMLFDRCDVRAAFGKCEDRLRAVNSLNFETRRFLLAAAYVCVSDSARRLPN